MWHHQVDWMSYYQEMHQGKERSVFCNCRHGVIYHCVMICCSVIATLLLSPNNPVENEKSMEWSCLLLLLLKEFFVLCCNRCKPEAVMLYVCAKVLWNTKQHFGHNICKLLANCIAYHPKKFNCNMQHFWTRLSPLHCNSAVWWSVNLAIQFAIDVHILNKIVTIVYIRHWCPNPQQTAVICTFIL